MFSTNGFLSYPNVVDVNLEQVATAPRRQENKGNIILPQLSIGIADSGPV